MNSAAPEAVCAEVRARRAAAAAARHSTGAASAGAGVAPAAVRSLALASLVVALVSGAAAGARAQERGAPAPAPRATADDSSPEMLAASRAVVERFAAEADVLVRSVGSDLAWSLLAGAADLPAPPARRLFVDRASGRWYPEAAAERLPDQIRTALELVELSPERFYTTKYGSPLAVVRAIDLVGQAGLEQLEGLSVLDIGYGGIGVPRLLALQGAHAVGLDVDGFLEALYAGAGDQGPVSTPDGPVGDVRLVHGSWPGDPAVRAAVGTGFSLILSKNTLKRGYVHPTREAPAAQLIDLGVDDASYLSALHDALLPGGFVLLYNLCPPEAGPDETYIPWADGRSPFTREQWAAAGLELLAFDVEDDGAARQLGVDLGWGTADELAASLEAWYTLARRPLDDGPR